LNGKSICTMKHRQSDSAMWDDLLKLKISICKVEKKSW